MSYTFYNDYRDPKLQTNSNLTPEGALAALDDMLRETRVALVAESESRRCIDDAAQQVALAQTSKQAIANRQEIIRAARKYPVGNDDIVVALDAAAESLYEAGKAAHQLLYERAERALMKREGL